MKHFHITAEKRTLVFHTSIHNPYYMLSRFRYEHNVDGKRSVCSTTYGKSDCMYCKRTMMEFKKPNKDWEKYKRFKRFILCMECTEDSKNELTGRHLFVHMAYNPIEVMCRNRKMKNYSGYLEDINFKIDIRIKELNFKGNVLRFSEYRDFSKIIINNKEIDLFVPAKDECYHCEKMYELRHGYTHCPHCKKEF